MVSMQNLNSVGRNFRMKTTIAARTCLPGHQLKSKGRTGSERGNRSYETSAAEPVKHAKNVILRQLNVEHPIWMTLRYVYFN